jgi:hypothetical protein
MVLEKFLEAIFETLFSYSVALLMMSVAPQKRRPLSADCSLRNRKQSSGAIQRDFPVLSLCSLLRNP